jgi:predicted GIY-YIG superfamily endonuclease
MFYVYLIQSLKDKSQKYVGFTTDLKKRYKAHNEGASFHTAKYRPWNLITYLGFEDEKKARAFEFYLKSHSGRAFADKRLW